MTLVAIPNISEGRSRSFVQKTIAAMTESGGKVLDAHSDERHNRSVFTVIAREDSLIVPMVALATVCREIDLRHHEGAHPRLGGLDVCPLVPFRTDMDGAIEGARAIGRAIAHEAGLPVYLYGKAAERAATRALPDIRRGGLERLIERSTDLPPDFGPATIDPASGAVCVGARGPLIAFNVWLKAPVDVARAIARDVREPVSGISGVRALGLDLGDGVTQVSMNLTDPERAGIDDTFDVVSQVAKEHDHAPWRTEIVGLVENRFLPDPEKEAARLLIQPGRDLESAISAF